MSEAISSIKAFLAVPKHLLWMLNYWFCFNFYYTILMWTPYYFTELGYVEQSSLISLMFPLMNCVSVLTINYGFSFCPSKVDICLLAFNLLTILIGATLAYLGNDESLAPVYLVLVMGLGFFSAPPCSQSGVYESTILTEGNRVLRTQIFLFQGLAVSFLDFISMLIVGALMEIGKGWLI